jgi:hypothetical protein
MDLWYGGAQRSAHHFERVRANDRIMAGGARAHACTISRGSLAFFSQSCLYLVIDWQRPGSPCGISREGVPSGGANPWLHSFRAGLSGRFIRAQDLHHREISFV